MFKQKIKTELEVFSEQRYKDTAVVIYHQLKKNNSHTLNEKAPKALVQGWIDHSNAAFSTQSANDAPQKSKETTEPVTAGHARVQSKFCTVS